MNYVTIYEEYKHKFFQLPMVFFTNEKYIDMSNNAKIAWSILRDRSSLSRKNKWYDKDTGRIYFIYKNKELMNILNIKSETTLANVKKELEKAELIEQQRIGFNRPNKLYLIYPIIEDDDIYKIDEFENYQYKSDKQPENQAEQGTPKNGVPKNGVPYPQKMESSNTDSSNTDLKDLDTIDTVDTNSSYINNNDFIDDKQKKKDEYIKKAFLKNSEKIPVRLAEMLDAFSRTIEDAEHYYKIINIAKSNFEKDYNEFIYLEHQPEILQKIIDTFSRSIRIIEKEGKDNPDGYIYKSIYGMLKNHFTDLSLNSMQHNKGNGNPEHILNYNYLEE